MFKYCLTFLSFFTFASAYCQDPATMYTSSTISADMKKDADAVVRLHEAVLIVLSPSEYSFKVHQVITVLNEEAASSLRHTLFTDKFNKVEEAEVQVYDAAGKPVKKYGKKDFEVEAYYDGFSLYTDDKLMRLYTPAPAYPCTIDVQYKQHATGYVELPNAFIDNNRIATEHFRYEVNVPASLDVRHRSLHCSLVPKVEEAAGQKRYVWDSTNIAARKREPEGYEPAHYLPQVEVAPNEFSYDGFKGSFRTWNDFGKWNYGFYEDKAPFSAARLEQIKALVATSATREAKIETLYRYLQENMRYVSIQLGIGGFKPFAVKFVDEKKYGDCKALTNYMRYLLQVVGINAYPALINGGYNKVPADPLFPSDPFNHVILCIPNGKDSTWLECTSNEAQAGELGTFTENKRALLLTEQGGILVNTPRSTARLNRVGTRNLVAVNANGGATIHKNIDSRGESAAFFRYVGQLKEDEQKETLIKNLHYKEPDQLQFQVPEDKTKNWYTESRMYEKLYDFKSGSKFFFPSSVNRLATVAPKLVLRESDYLFRYPYEKTDTTVFQLPANFAVETLPASKELKTDYTAYRRSCSFDKATNTLTIVSSLSLFQNVIPAASYTGVATFFKDVTAAEEENFILNQTAAGGFN